MSKSRTRREVSPRCQCTSLRAASVIAVTFAACGGSLPTHPRQPDEAAAPHLRRSAIESAEQHSAERHTEPIADPARGSDVSLAGILAYADRNSPVLNVARATRSRAEAARIAAAVTLPTNPELRVAAGPRFAESGTALEFEASVLQQLEVSGQRTARRDAAEELRKLTDAEIEEVRWAVHCDVHAAFHRALVDREQLLLAQRIVEFQREVLRAVERQIAAGETAPLTLRLAQAEVAQAEQVHVASEQSFHAARLHLARLSGWPAATPPLPGGHVDPPHEPPSLDQLMQAARGRQPGLRALQARAKEAQARVFVEERQSSVKPSLGVEYQREGASGLVPAANVVMGVVSVPVPLQATNQGNHAAARADETIARAELAAAEQLLEGELAAARSEVAAAAKRSRAYGSEILPRFEENLTLLRRSFELGEIDILALSTGRERFLRIQNDALAAQRDYFVALASLERVVGVDLWHDHHEADTTADPAAIAPNTSVPATAAPSVVAPSSAAPKTAKPNTGGTE